MCKSLIKPLPTYGLQLWGDAKKSNFNKIRAFRNIVHRKIANAPPYISNLTLHSDLKIETVYNILEQISPKTRPFAFQPARNILGTLTIAGVHPNGRFKRS